MENSKNLMEQHEKLLKKVLEGKENMSVYAYANGQSFVVIEGVRVPIYGILIAIVNQVYQICCGKVGQHNVWIANRTDIPPNLSLIIDERKKETSMHLRCNVDFMEYSMNAPLNGHGKVIMYFENDKYAQLHLYDTRLKYSKHGTVFATEPEFKTSVRSIALSYMTEMFPGLMDAHKDFPGSKED